MQKIYHYLTYAGTLPFLFCAVCLTLDIQTIFYLGNTHQVLSIYALIIASFMAGSHWGQNLNDQSRLYPSIFSNLIAVILWIAFLVLPFKYLLFAFSLSFLALLSIDKKLHADGLISAQYFKTRSIVTAIVILTLAISGVYA